MTVLCLTFKENCPDLRNSRVIDIIHELQDYGITVQVHDPLADAAESLHEYGVTLVPLAELQSAAAVVVAVAHKEYLTFTVEQFKGLMGRDPILIDVKSICDSRAMQGASPGTQQLLKTNLRANPKTWLITGCAGFIGSNLLEALLKLDQTVVGLDNFATGKQRNLDEVQTLVSREQWARFRFIKGDIREPACCAQACAGVDYVLHQAALGSVPRSIADPVAITTSNVNGTLNMLVAARDAKVQRFVYASSSSVYGDHPALPKLEANIGTPLSPYAVTKYVNELYSAQFGRHYGLGCIGLRYFNVFGPRQDPDGPYAAVIPKWVAAMIAGDAVVINGSGETSRDFCYIANVVQMNLLAASCSDSEAVNQVYNVAVNARTDLNELFELLRSRLVGKFPLLKDFKPDYQDFRAGDVLHSQADISKAARFVGYEPTYSIAAGLDEALAWHVGNIKD